MLPKLWHSLIWPHQYHTYPADCPRIFSTNFVLYYFLTPPQNAPSHKFRPVLRKSPNREKQIRVVCKARQFFPLNYFFLGSRFSFFSKERQLRHCPGKEDRPKVGC